MNADQDVRHNTDGRRGRPPRDWDSEIEKGIEAAMARGDFSDLPGRGQPLKWDSDRDDDTWLANHLLENAGFRPAWIDDDVEIRAERAALAELLDDFAAWYAQAQAEFDGLAEPAAGERRADLGAARARRVATYRDRAEKLNRLIDRFNLTVPIAGRQHFRCRIDAEIAAFEARLDPAGR